MDEHLQEQASAYALGILPEAEKAEFERALVRDAELRRLVREFRDALGVAAQSMPAAVPSAGLKGRIMDRIADEATGEEPVPAPVRTAGRVSWFPVILPWAVAASLAVAFAWFYNDAGRRMGELRSTVASTEAALAAEKDAFEKKVAALQSELIAAHDAANLAKLQIARLSSEVQPRVQAVSFWNNTTKQGVLVVENLALPPPGKTYQLWVIDPETKSPIDAGIFATDPDGTGRIAFTPKANVNTATAIAVSLEEAGGVAVPTQVVMAGATAPF
jgi:anti-sigma-K factor RskA